MPDAAPSNEVPPAVRRDRLAERKAEVTVELVNVRQQIGDVRGNAAVGRQRIPSRDWSNLLKREVALKAEISRIELDLVRNNREASERRWRVESDARALLASVVKCAVQLCDDDSDANWQRLESALNMLRDKCPEYVETHGL